jgi:acyl-coenzyme A synthetase/AMP-(fatty) acid ligase
MGLHLLSVSLADEPPLGLEAFEAPHPLGGHILLTSGTTGINKMVLMSPACDANFMRLQVELFGLNQHTLLSVFHLGAWVGLAYKWAASVWSVGGATLIEQGRELYHVLLHPGITYAVLNPTMLAAILAAPANAFPRNDTMQLAVGAGAMTNAGRLGQGPDHTSSLELYRFH